MGRLKRIFLISIAALSCLGGSAQELNCTFEIDTKKVNNANKDIFNTLQEAVNEYLNTTVWTDAQFAANEKIQCKMYLTIAEYDESTGKMKGDLQVQSTRPVYNSSYTTTLINFKDTRIEFTYDNNEQLVYNEQEMQSNLTAILNFYALFVIALDFDSFALNGGDPYFEKLGNIVRMAQSSGESGWKAFEDSKNRSAVLSAYTDKQTSAIREIFYNYHRLGLDQMVTSVDKGRQTITQSLETLKKIYDVAPMSVCLSMFKDAKMDELVNIYSKANSTEKEKVYETLYPLYPTETDRLNRIKNTDIK
ncbi:MAG: DUF4835 family protein [Muribaculaceae bacterium]|nr:DUF4835 family protein [Muribaculaceae bacterium]MDY6413279.1 DUF4835 family protein [Bacteroidales bacterium]